MVKIIRFAILVSALCAYLLLATIRSGAFNQPTMTYRGGAFVKGIHQLTKATSHSNGNQTTPSNISSGQNSIQTVGYDIDAEVIPRKVYYDNRTVANKSRDVVYILADISNYSFRKGSITHCELNGQKSRRVHISPDPMMAWVRRYQPKVTHFFAMVERYGLPHSAIFNGSIAYVVYKGRKNKALVRVQAEHSLLFNNMDNNLTPMRGNNSVVMCTSMFDHPPRFNEWLIYQKTLGFDRVHLNVDESFSNNATIIYPFLAEGLKSGFVVMEVWNKYRDNAFYYSQALKIHDCIMRYRGVFDYAFVLDYDDFINPMIPEQNDIHYYVKKMFQDSSIGCAKILWLELPCELDLEALSLLKDGNVTKTLKSNYSIWRNEEKSVSKLSGVIMATAHRASDLLPSFNSKNVYDKTLLYIAHIRTDKTKCKS